MKTFDGMTFYSKDSESGEIMEFNLQSLVVAGNEKVWNLGWSILKEKIIFLV